MQHVEPRERGLTWSQTPGIRRAGNRDGIWRRRHRGHASGHGQGLDDLSVQVHASAGFDRVMLGQYAVALSL